MSRQPLQPGSGLESLRPEIAAMQGYTPGEQPRTSKIIKLNTNENPYPPSEAVARAIASVAQAGLQRYPDPVASSFRNVAAEVLGVEPNWILCGNGSDDILTIVTRAFVGQGELLRLPYPSYILYRTLAQLQGAKYEEVHFNADWTLPEEFSAAKDSLKLVFLPNPNSPSGTVLSPEQVLEIAQKLPCPLLVDEAYADFAEQNCISLVKESDKIMVSRTLSKSYGLAGLRFGFLVAQPHVIDELVKVKDSYNCDSLSIAGATAAIHDQPWLKNNLEQIKTTRSRLVQGLRSLGFEVVDSQANFAWAVNPNRELKPIYEELKAQQILVRYMQYAGWGEGLRISVGTEGQTEACLQLLEQILQR